MIGRALRLRLFAVFAAGLLSIAWLSPQPGRITDRGIYEAAAAQFPVRDCSDLQCFRVLVPWTLRLFPGSSDARWKSYAAVCNAAAAVALIPLCLAFGLGRRAALIASVVSASGFGSFYTLHDPFTSDPLMFVMGPLLTYQLLMDRIALAGAVAVVGVFAKEFAAAPVYAFAACSFVERRWLVALRAIVAGNFAFLTWVALTVSLMLGVHYTWGRNGVGSANLSQGAALAMWLREQSLRGIASAMFNEFGALYVLVPAGFLLAPSRLRRLALVSLPIAALFCVVQQPDRALWNFHYLIVPFAAVVLAAVPAALAWTTVALFAVGNLRLGAQLPIAGTAHVAIAGSLVLAVASAALALRAGAAGVEPTQPGVAVR